MAQNGEKLSIAIGKSILKVAKKISPIIVTTAAAKGTAKCITSIMAKWVNTVPVSCPASTEML